METNPTIDSLKGKLSAWIHEALNQDIPENVNALCFNLFEWGGGDFGIEMIGTSFFDKDDPDWACDEIWEPVPRSLSEEFTAKNWESYFEITKTLISPIVAQQLSNKKNLHIIAVAIGFVDGDLEEIFERGSLEQNSY